MVLVLLSPHAGAQRRVGAAARRTARIDREARNLFEAGQDAFDSGNYERALDYFERAHALTQRAGFLYNIATTADRMRADQRALEAYRAYLEAEPDTERRAEVEARITFIEGLLRPPPPPEPEPEPAPAPVVEVVVRAPPPAPPPPEPSGVHPAGVVTLIGSGLLFASFGVFGGLSLAEDGRLAGTCGRDVGATCSDAQVADLRLYNMIADASWISGSVAAVVGLALVLALPSEGGGSTGEQMALVPWAHPAGAGTTWVGRW